MRRLLVQLIKGCRGRHKKLEEECCQTTDCVLEGVTFYVAYLGSCLVDTPSGEETTSQAVKTIVAMAKKLDKKLDQVALTVSLRGIRMEDCSTGDLHFEFSIYRISYCSADATYDHVFNFIATNSNNTMECHAFLCKKRKIAQSATLTIAQAFNLAYSYWLAAHERRRRKDKEKRRQQLECSCDTRRERRRTESASRLTSQSSRRPQKSEESDKSPSSGYSSQDSNTEDQAGERLLIDLSSPAGNVTNTWADINIIDTDGDTEDKIRDLSFTDIALRKTPAPILSKLPENALGSEMKIDSFVPSELTVASLHLKGESVPQPPPTPLHGSHLTNSALCTPSGSPVVIRPANRMDNTRYGSSPVTSRRLVRGGESLLACPPSPLAHPPAS